MNATVVSESFRMIRAQERLSALLRPLEQMDGMIDDVLEVAPDLGPEMNEVRGRLVDMCGHLRASAAVLTAKVELL